MSSAEDNPSKIDYDPDETPDVDLEYIIDVTDEPSKITIFLPSEGTDVTHWMTADSADAIPLDEMR